MSKRTRARVLPGLAVAGMMVLGSFTTVKAATAAPSGTTVSRWETDEAGDRLTQLSNLTFYPDDGANLPTIQVDPNRYYQAIDGFGGTFNEAGWDVLQTLSTSEQDAVLKELFDPVSGAGFTLTRVPIGGDDFSCTDLNNTCPEYTDDDISSGTDFNMSQFSLSRDLQRLIPYVKAAQAYGNFQIVASPWSAPAWMKTNGSLDGGGSVIPPSTDPRYYTAYALYFKDWVQAWAQQDVNVNYVSVQNEPQNAANYASTLWTSSEMADFVANYLGPEFASNGVTARIRIYDHNRDTWQYPTQVLSDSSTLPYVAGVDFHDYECIFGEDYCMAPNIGLFHDADPGYSAWMTELTDVGAPDPTDYLDGEKWGNWIINDMNAGMGAFIYWNMVLDQNGGPVEVPQSSYQSPLVDVDTSTGTVNYMPRFWYLAQFSKFVRPGAYRIGADGAQSGDGLNFTAFKNPDGSEVFVIVNSNDSAVQVKIREGGNVIEPTLDAHSINTFEWNAPVNSYHIIAGSTGSWESAAGDMYSADAYYSGGGTAVNVEPIGGTPDAPLYQSERNGNFSYSFPVPDGPYQVTLKFSENYWNCSGCREFDVSLQGNTVLSDFDIYAAAGGEYKAIDESFVADVTNGAVDLVFTSVIDKAKVDAIAITPLPTAGSAFTDSSLPEGTIAPGYVMAENYNTGGSGYAYQFAYSGGSDFSYRPDAINLEQCSNDSHCGDDLGWLSSGDWVNYTVDVVTGSNYDVDFRVASPNTGGQLSLDMDGVNIVPTTSVPDTGGWQDWTDVWAYGVDLAPGVHTFTFHVVTGGFNLLYFQLKKVTRLDVLPTTVDAVWYAGGGQGVGYSSSTSGDYFTNPYPGYLRADDVGIEISSMNSFDIGDINNGNWLRYDVWSPSSTTYTVSFAVASIYTSGQLRLDLDTVGNTIGSVLSVPDTGGWETWQTVSESVTVPSGTHALYVYFPSGGFNFNNLTFSS